MKKSVNPWLALVFICLTTMAIIGGDAIIAPLTSIIASQEGFTISGFMATLSAPVNCIFILLAGFLVTKFRKKNLMIASFGFFVLLGISAVLMTQFNVGAGLPVLIFALCGVAQGMFTVLNNRMIAEIFPDELKRSRAMGFYTAAIAVMAILLMNLSAALAGTDGNYLNSFRVFFLVVPIMIAVLFIPKDEKPSNTEAPEKITWNKEVLKDGWKIWLSFGFIQIFYQNWFQFGSYVFELKNIAQYTAILTSLLFIGVLIAGFIFGFIYKKLKFWTSSVVYLIGALFLAVIYFSNNPIITGIGMFGMGFMYSTMYALTFLKASMMKYPTTHTMMIGIVIGIFVFFTPHLYNLLVFITKTDHLQIMPIMFVTVVVGWILSILFNKKIIK